MPCWMYVPLLHACILYIYIVYVYLQGVGTAYKISYAYSKDPYCIPIIMSKACIMKTRLFKYIENFTTKKWKLSDEKFW